MTLAIPPFYDVLIEIDKDNNVVDGKTNLNWTVFFQNLADGNAGVAWNPTFQSLGVSGTPIISGTYFQISKYLTYFQIVIDPNGGNTTSTAATTYCDNFPLLAQSDGVCFASSGSGAAQSIGGVRAADNRIYPPAWTSVTTTLTIVGAVVT